MSNPNVKTKKTEDIFELTQEGSINPSATFVKELEERLVEKFSNDSNRKSNISFWNIMSRIQKIALASVGAVVIAVGGYFTYRYMYPPIDSADLLSKIAAANLDTKNRSKLAAPTAAGAESSLSADLAIWRGNAKSYNESTYQSKTGPSVGKCEMYKNPLVTDAEAAKGIKSSYRSFYKDGVSYYEDKIETADGRLVSYSLTLDNKYYSYLGGKYAVLTIYPESNNFLMEPAMTEEKSVSDDTGTGEGTGETVLPVEPDAPVSEEPVVDEPVVDQPVVDPAEEPTTIDPLEFFGEDAKVVGTDKIDGTDVYVIEYSADLYCGGAVLYDTVTTSKGGTSLESQDSVKGVIRQYVDQETYQYLKTETYFDKVDDKNLVNTESFTFDEREMPLADAKGLFVWNLDVPLKTYEVPSFENDSIASLDKMKADGNVLFMVEGTVINSVYSSSLMNTPNSDLTSKRDFFPAGKLGDSQYNEIASNIDQYPSDIYYLNAGNDTFTSYYGVSVYDIADADKIFKNSGYDTITFKDVSIKVGNKTVLAKFVDQSYVSDVSAPSEGAGTDSVEPKVIAPEDSYKSYTYIVEYEDYYIIISGSVEVTSISALDLSVAANYNKIVESLEKYADQNSYNPEIAY